MIEGMSPEPSTPSSIPDTRALESRVRIRTMQSDILIAKQGGAPVALGTPEGFVVDKGADFVPSSIPTSDTARSNPFIWFVMGVAVLGILFMIGYFVVPLFSKRPASPVVQTPATTTPSVTPPPSAPVPAVFFASAPDDIVSVAVGALDTSSTYAAKLRTALAGARPSAAFVELSLITSSSAPVGWESFSDMLGVPVFDRSFFESNFVPQFGAFAYLANGHAFPGYILRASSTLPDIVLKNQAIASIEIHLPSINGFFLDNPGTPQGGFTDGALGGQSIRVRTFKTTTFAYGWFNDTYLLISASLDGLRQAVAHLGAM